MERNSKPRSPLKALVRRGVLIDLEKKGITPELSQKALESFLSDFRRRPICSAVVVDRRVAVLGSSTLEQHKRAYAVVAPKEKIGYIKQVYPIRNAEGLLVRIEADVVLYVHRLRKLGFKGSVRALVKCRRIETRTYRDTVILNELLGFDFILKEGRKKC